MTQNPIGNKSSILDVDNIRIDGNTISSTDGDGNIIIAPNGTGDVSVTTAPIVPSGDRVDSLGSGSNSWDNVYADGFTFDDGTNILANYVDKTAWTPTIVGSTVAGAGTYTVQVGSYCRVGKIVFLTWYLVWTAHTGAGNIRLGNIPIAPTTVAVRPCGTVQWGDGMVIQVGGVPLWCQVVGAGDASSTQLFFQYNNTVGGAENMVLDVSASVIGSLCYFTD